MCLSVPARVVDITPGVLPMAHLDHGGHLIECCLAYVPEATVGDYVLTQNGFAVELMDAQAAAESLAAFAELGLT